MKKKTVIKPFIPSMSNIIEKWLTQMSLNGFALIYNNWWKFVFVETSPKHREYCLYSGFDASKGIWADYYLAKKLCGKTKGKLLKNTYGIFEIDKDRGRFLVLTKVRQTDILILVMRNAKTSTKA